MKSFSNLLEKAETPSVKDNLAQDRANRKYEKKFGRSLSAQDAERIDSARLLDIERESRGKKGQEIKKNVIKTQGQEDLLNKIQPQRPVKKGEKFYGKPSSVDINTGKAKYVPPKEIPGRTRYLDPKTNKASEEGIKKYISKARQMRTGSNIPVDSKTTDSIAKIAKSEYTDKINREYGGRRARRAYSNAPSFADVQKQVNLKDRLKQKFGKGEYRKGFKKTQGVNQADVSKKIASDTKAYNQKRTSSTFKDFSKQAAEIGKRKSQSTTKFDAVNRFNDIWDDGDMGNPSSTQTPKKPTSTKIGSKTVTPDWGKVKDGVKKSKVTSVLNNRKTDKLMSINTPSKPPKLDKVTSSQTNFVEPPKPKKGTGLTVTKQGKSYKEFMKSAAPGKGFVKSKAKLFRPKGWVSKGLKGSGKLLGKAAAPIDAVISTLDAKSQYRKKGHSKTGSWVRGAIKGVAGATGAVIGGGLAGTAGLVSGPGAFAAGAGGAIGGHMLGSALADKAIAAYDKVFKPKAKLDKKYQDPKYVEGVVKQKKAKKPVTGLSLGVSDKQWKARFGEEYVQERVSLKDKWAAKKAAENKTNMQAAEIKKNNPGAFTKSFSGALLNKNTSNNTTSGNPKAQDALNRNPGNPPQGQDGLNRNPGNPPQGTPANNNQSSSGGLTTLSGRPSRLPAHAQRAILNMKKDASDAGIKPNEGPSTVSKVNSTGTAQKVDNQSQQKTVTKPFDKSKDIGGTSAIADKDKITPVSSTSGPGRGSIKLPPGGLSKLAPKNNQQPSGGGSTPQARPVPQAGSTPQARPVPQAQQAQRPVAQAQAQRPVAQAQRTVGGQGNRQRPVKTGGIQLGNAIRKPIGSAINAVRSALSNRGPIQGRQTGAQRRAAQTANRPVAKPVTQAPVAKPVQAAPVAKPVTQAPVAKPVTQAPVAKPAPQLTGAQRAQQMAKQRIAQGRNTVTGALKSAAKPKPKVTTWRDLE